MIRALRAWVVASGVTLAVPAHAYVCTRVAPGDPNAAAPALAWGARNVVYTFQADGTKQLTAQDTFDALTKAFGVWHNTSLDPTAQNCTPPGGTDISFSEGPVRSHATWVGYDFLNPGNNENLLIFRDQAWPNPADAIDIIALTTTTYSALTGELIDADIEFNSATFTFSTAQMPPPNTYDLLNTAVHEVGHFIGLAHCSATTCGNHEVMEPRSDAGEITKRLLKCDDRAAVVFKYPAGQPNGYCPGLVNETCGFCEAPSIVPLRPVIKLVSQTTGRGGPACSTNGGAFPWMVALLGLRRVWRRLRGLRRATALLWVGLLGACHGPECDGTVPPADPNAPLIVSMTVFGQVQNDPWRVILATDFIDLDGDLGTGQAYFYPNYNTTPSPPQQLRALFESSSGLDPASTSGRFALPLRFSEQTRSSAVLHLGAQLVDAANNRSNCYTLDMSFDLSN